MSNAEQQQTPSGPPPVPHRYTTARNRRVAARIFVRANEEQGKEVPAWVKRIAESS